MDTQDGKAVAMPEMPQKIEKNNDMKMVFETNTDSKPKDLAWLNSKWWFRLFKAALWVVAIFMALFTVIGTFGYVSEGCHAATLDTLDSVDFGSKYPADSAKVEKYLRVGSDGRVDTPPSEDDPLGLFDDGYGKSPTGYTAKNVEKEEQGKDYGCVFSGFLVGAVILAFIFGIRKVIEMLFIYVAIGNDGSNEE